MSSRLHATVAPIIALAAALSGCTSSSLSGHHQGNGGDPIHALMDSGKKAALAKALEFKTCKVHPGASTEAREWLSSNSDALIEELKSLSFVWHDRAQETCAWTSRKPKAALLMSLRECERVKSEAEAAELLIHEAIHHIDLTIDAQDEDLAREAARAVMQTEVSQCIPDESAIAWLEGAGREWKVTARIEKVDFSPEQQCFTISQSTPQWPARDMGGYVSNGNYWIVAFVDGRWQAATYDWMVVGNRCDGDPAETIGSVVKRRQFDGWIPRSGELVGFMVSSMIRFGERAGAEERSEIHWTVWP